MRCYKVCDGKLLCTVQRICAEDATKVNPYRTVTGHKVSASLPATSKRSIFSLENRAVIPHPSCSNLVLRNMHFAPPYPFGLRSPWSSAFTLPTTFLEDTTAS